MAANLFWVGETGVEERGMARGVGGTTGACARNSYVARKRVAFADGAG